MFKDFWKTLKTEWTAAFGCKAEGNIDEKWSPCLNKVSSKVVMWKGSNTENKCAATVSVVQQQREAE